MKNKKSNILTDYFGLIVLGLLVLGAALYLAYRSNIGFGTFAKIFSEFKYG